MTTRNTIAQARRQHISLSRRWRQVRDNLHYDDRMSDRIRLDRLETAIVEASAKISAPPANTAGRARRNPPTKLGTSTMASFKYFADLFDETIEFTRVDHRTTGPDRGTYGWSPAHGQWIKTNRRVRMKTSPSRHRCDDRCIYATGTIMNCECSCGGKNHGRGHFTNMQCELMPSTTA